MVEELAGNRYFVNYIFEKTLTLPANRFIPTVMAYKLFWYDFIQSREYALILEKNIRDDQGFIFEWFVQYYNHRSSFADYSVDNQDNVVAQLDRDPAIVAERLDEEKKDEE